MLTLKLQRLAVGKPMAASGWGQDFHKWRQGVRGIANKEIK